MRATTPSLNPSYAQWRSCAILQAFSYAAAGPPSACVAPPRPWWDRRRLVEPHGRARKPRHQRGAYRGPLADLQRRHLVFAAAREPRLDPGQTLAAPEAEQHPRVLGPDQQVSRTTEATSGDCLSTGEAISRISLRSSELRAAPLFPGHHPPSGIDIGRHPVLAGPVGVFRHRHLFHDLVARLARLHQRADPFDQ